MTNALVSQMTSAIADAVGFDRDRDVSDARIFACIDTAEQAPSGGNDASWRWLVIRDQHLKDEFLGADWTNATETKQDVTP